METELKFRVVGKVKPALLEQIDWHPFHLGDRQLHQLHDQVLDTPDRRVTRAMHGLRVRQDGETTYLTLKAPGQPTTGAYHTREELQDVIPAGDIMAPERWPEPIRGRVAALVADQPLEPLLTIHNKRRTWDVCRDGQVVAELALDSGEIQANGAVEGLHEIEVELKGSGAESDLQLLEQRLRQNVVLEDEPRTKLQRGLALLEQATSQPGVSPHPARRMNSRDPIAEAARSVLRGHWQLLSDSEAGVVAGMPEAVHNMRVATRRLRALLDVLGGPVYEPALARRLRRGLKRLAHFLGNVRDVEVWSAGVEDYLAEQPAARPGLQHLLDNLQARRATGRAALLAYLENKHYARLRGRLEEFVTTPGAGVVEPSATTGPLLVRDIAGSALWTRVEQVQAFDAVMPAAPLVTLHELRIACKHLRYTLDLFKPVLGKGGKKMRAQLARAQEHLGLLNDAEVALPAVERLLQDDPENAALVAYQTYLRERRDQLWSGVDDVWRRVGGRRFRQRLASTIAAL